MMDLDLRKKIEEMIVNSSVSNAAIELRVKEAFNKAIMAETTNQVWSILIFQSICFQNN